MIAHEVLPLYLGIGLTALCLGVLGFVIVAAIAIWKDYW